MTIPGDEELFAYLDGEVAPERALELDAWAASPVGHERLSTLRGLTASLEGAPSGSDVDLFPGVEAKLNARRRRPVAFAVVAAALAAAVALLFFVGREPETRIKGSALTPQQWAGVQLYRVGDGTPSRLAETLGANESVLVAYTNGGEAPFTHLMVFAVDSRRRVYWYYPEWLDAQQDPESISISATQTPIELHERITHEFAPGRVVMHAVFSHRVLRVSEVERAISLGGLQFEDVVHQQLAVEVQ